MEKRNRSCVGVEHLLDVVVQDALDRDHRIHVGLRSRLSQIFDGVPHVADVRAPVDRLCVMLLLVGVLEVLVDLLNLLVDLLQQNQRGVLRLLQNAEQRQHILGGR